MTKFTSWDSLVRDADRAGQLACYKLETLLQIYGATTVTETVNNDIATSLERRDYAMQPRNLIGLPADAWIRIYYRDNLIGSFLETVLTISPDGNDKLHTLLKKQKRDDAIVTEIMALLKTMNED